MRALAQYATCNMGEEGQEKGYPKTKDEDGRWREQRARDGERWGAREENPDKKTKEHKKRRLVGALGVRVRAR